MRIWDVYKKRKDENSSSREKADAQLSVVAGAVASFQYLLQFLVKKEARRKSAKNMIYLTVCKYLGIINKMHYWA